mmetsp:Transcript_39520/g.57711  ORF Transcript_39520/g.57711 Transcript_39520/m.57711 type:complete len:94 (-) Transcript_39520:21-302(-)
MILFVVVEDEVRWNEERKLLLCDSVFVVADDRKGFIVFAMSIHVCVCVVEMIPFICRRLRVYVGFLALFFGGGGCGLLSCVDMHDTRQVLATN